MSSSLELDILLLFPDLETRVVFRAFDAVILQFVAPYCQGRAD